VADRLKTRVRANFRQTSVKHGYRPDFTIEVEWAGDDPEADEDGLYRFGSLIQEVERKAFAKVNELNVREGYPLIPLDVPLIREEESTNGGTRFRERIDEETGEIFS
jgi:hypothetical protein